MRAYQKYGNILIIFNRSKSENIFVDGRNNFTLRVDPSNFKRTDIIKKSNRLLCEICDTYNIGYKIHGRFICESCLKNIIRFPQYYTCEVCGARTVFVKPKNTINSNETLSLCKNCYNNRDYFKCEECHSILRRYKKNGIKIKDKYYCENCFSRRFPVYRFSYKPRPIFFSESKTQELDFVGFELEVEFDKRDPRRFCADGKRWELYSIIAERAFKIKKKLAFLGLERFIYLKLDGTIFGIELVSHPFDYAWFIKNKNKLKKLFDFLKAIGGVSYKYGRAGIHFHINNNLTFTEVKKLFLFYNNNTQHIFKLAQRGSGTYCMFYFIAPKVLIHNINRQRYHYNHHHALNITLSTIEQKFFRGSLNFRVFEGLTEFVFATKEFIRKNSILFLLKSNSWNYFERYCKEVGYKKFILLWEELKRKKKAIEDKTRKIKTI